MCCRVVNEAILVVEMRDANELFASAGAVDIVKIVVLPSPVKLSILIPILATFALIAFA